MSILHLNGGPEILPNISRSDRIATHASYRDDTSSRAIFRQTNISIPSIITRAFTNSYKKWEKQPEDLVRTIFALEPGQSRKPRVSKRSGTTKPMKKRSSEEAQSDSAGKMLKKVKFGGEKSSLIATSEDGCEDT